MSKSSCGKEVKRNDALAYDFLGLACLANLGAYFLVGRCLDGLGRIGDQGQDGLELCLGFLGESLDRLDGGELAGLGQAGLAVEQEELIFSSLIGRTRFASSCESTGDDRTDLKETFFLQNWFSPRLRRRTGERNGLSMRSSRR